MMRRLERGRYEHVTAHDLIFRDSERPGSFKPHIRSHREFRIHN